MTLAYLGLGANLGDARQTLKDAVICLAQQADITVTAKSGLYRTAPVNAPGPEYYNSVVAVQTALSPCQLLAACHLVESHLGRERHYHHAPRTLDIDLLLYGDQTLAEEDLTVPHPRLTQRAFVLAPLAELDPKLVIPGLDRNVCELLSQPTLATQAIEKISPGCCPCRKG